MPSCSPKKCMTKYFNSFITLNIGQQKGTVCLTHPNKQLCQEPMIRLDYAYRKLCGKTCLSNWTVCYVYQFQQLCSHCTDISNIFSGQTEEQGDCKLSGV